MEVTLEVLGNLAHKPPEWEFVDEHVQGLLVAPDLAEGDSAGAGGFLTP